ncbi:BRO family protein [Enterobacteriaceae bacterium ESL0689]|nr:BRO family protein [Enterobacteriaceae bacterium ESL0689]
MTTSLVFHNVNFNIINRNNQIWLTAVEIAQALQYKTESSVSRIYSRYSDEFTAGMSETVKLTVSGNLTKVVRIFSLRGAHLIAMFARTPVAKEFRRWVLDILDREVAINLPAKDDPSIREKHAYNANALAKHYEVMYEAWKNQIYPALRAIESPLATRLCDRFKDSAIFMMYVQEEAEKQLQKGEVARIL